MELDFLSKEDNKSKLGFLQEKHGILKSIANDIDGYMFKYKDEFKGTHDSIDDDVHYGIMAQDLEENPLTESAVEEMENGYKGVNAIELCMANTAMISELAKELLALIEKENK